jgi:hypothetical protein
LIGEIEDSSLAYKSNISNNNDISDTTIPTVTPEKMEIDLTSSLQQATQSTTSSNNIDDDLLQRPETPSQTQTKLNDVVMRSTQNQITTETSTINQTLDNTATMEMDLASSLQAAVESSDNAKAFSSFLAGIISEEKENMDDSFD